MKTGRRDKKKRREDDKLNERSLTEKRNQKKMAKIRENVRKLPPSPLPPSPPSPLTSLASLDTISIP